MVNLIEQVFSVLPAAQKEAISRLLNQKSKRMPMNRRTLARESDFLSDLSSQTFASRFSSLHKAFPGEVISSKEWNENFQNIFIDLNSLYRAVNDIQRNFLEQEQSTNDDIVKLRAALLKVIQQAIIFKFLRDNREYQEVKIIDFIDGINDSKFKPKALIDSDIHALELPVESRELLQRSNRDFKNTNVEIKTIGGGIVSKKDDTFGPEQMLDRVPGTFWAEMILSNAPIYQQYNTSQETGSSVIDVYGPIAEVVFTFSQPELVNSVKILPFGEYPIRIVDISYKETETTRYWKNIKNFRPTRNNINSWYEVNFIPKTISQLRVSVAQESYVQNTYHLPRDIVYSTDIFQHIVDENFRRDIGDSQRLDKDLGFLNLDNKASLYLEALDDFSDDILSKFLEKSPVKEFELLAETIDSISRVLTNIDPEQQESILEAISSFSERDRDRVVSIKKYEYIIGIREVEISFNKYKPVGFYSSPKFRTKATITDIELVTDENHSVFYDDFGTHEMSSIEYEVELSEDRILPIVPKNSTGNYGEIYVKNEYLRFDRTRNKARTRFKKRNDLYELRKNGEYVPVTDYTATGDSDGYFSIAINRNFSPNAIYSFSYYPHPSSSLIDVLGLYNSELMVPEEKFSETGPNNSISLEAFPYIEYEFLNQTGYFIPDNSTNSSWNYQSPINPYTSGTVVFYPKITDSSGSVLFAGTGLAYGASGANFTANLTGSYLIDPFGYEIRFRDLDFTTEITGFFSTTGLYFSGAPSLSEFEAQSFGTAYNTGDGSIVSDYSINVTYTADGQTFGMSNPTYEPLVVTVNGTKAKNFTNYQTREHRAFSGRQTLQSNYEFIHRGNKIYFNKAIRGEILVSYRWISRYLRLRAELYNHQPANPVVTPQLKEARFLLKTSPL